MNIIVICHFFAPEPAAPAARWLDFCTAWDRVGHSVKVITCFPNHPTGSLPQRYRHKLRTVESIEGIRVHRHWVYARRGTRTRGRTLNHLSFMVSSLMSLRSSGTADVVVVSSPTFFSLVTGYVYSRVKRVPLVVEVRDLWPAAVVELGVLKNRFVAGFLEAMERWVYRAASHIVVVTEAFRSNLVARGVNADKVSVITNGVNPSLFAPGDPDDGIRQICCSQDKLLILYVGTHGLGQQLETILYAAALLRNRSDVCFALVGDGMEKETLQQLATELDLTNIRFLPPQPRNTLRSWYNTADICLVSLRPVPLLRSFIPSKIFDIMACGRPIIAALEGEAKVILERSNGALVVPPGDSEALARAIVELAQQPLRRQKLSTAATAFAIQNYSIANLATEYERLLASVVSGGT